jgi:D-3-phosphoglycerate dehydrogenase
MKLRIAISDCDHGYLDPEKNVCAAEDAELVFAGTMNAQTVIEKARTAQGLLCQRFQVTKEVMDALPQLKVIGRYGSGVDNVDIAEAKKRGIRVVYAPHFCFTDVANHTVAGLLYLSRGLHNHDHYMKNRTHQVRDQYDQRVSFVPHVRRPTSMTVGIVGFGKIGRAVAARLRPFGYTITAYDPYVPEQLMAEFGAKKSHDLVSLARISDFLTVHTPLNVETRNLINATVIGAMKPSTYLLNNARGGIVDEKALYDALTSGKLAGAALDVLEEEPVRTDLPFIKLHNVLLSPHMAFYSQESLSDLKERVMKYMVAALNGKGEWEEV